MKNLFKPAVILGFALALMFATTACDSTQQPALNESEVRAYADPATETLLQGLSQGALDMYVQYGNDEFKDAVTQGIFDEVADQIQAQFGDYVSKEFLSAEMQQGYVVVHYKATYTDGEIGVRTVFDDSHEIAGQFFE